MKESSVRRIAFPRYAEYNCGLKYVIEQGLDTKCVLQPQITKRTVELGARYSPDFACTPFKTVLGSFIEALEAGADTLLMVHGSCKLGYFGEVQEQILRDLGYEFEFVNLAEYDTGKKQDFLKVFKRLNPHYNMAHLVKAAAEAVRMVEHMDEITEAYYQNCGFETEPGAYRLAYQTFLDRMYATQNKEDIEQAYLQVKSSFRSIPLDKPMRPLRVGIVGEFYTAMDAPSNLETEEKLSRMGVEVHRWMNISNFMLHYPGDQNLRAQIKDLCTYEMGPTSTANIWRAKYYAEQGFDGLIHIKSANCTPEIDVMPVLQNISRQYQIPALFLTFDSQTSDVGLMTRLEAFYDMIEMKKRRL